MNFGGLLAASVFSISRQGMHILSMLCGLRREWLLFQSFPFHSVDELCEWLRGQEEASLGYRALEGVLVLTREK